MLDRYFTTDSKIPQSTVFTAAIQYGHIFLYRFGRSGQIMMKNSVYFQDFSLPMSVVGKVQNELLNVTVSPGFVS
jgi:hypothetical protein